MKRFRNARVAMLSTVPLHHLVKLSNKPCQSVSATRGAIPMSKFYRHYIRYAVTVLAPVGFGLGQN